MGRAYSTHEGEERCLQDFGGDTGWIKDHLEDLGIDKGKGIGEGLSHNRPSRGPKGVRVG